jgi:hypothetical protein
MISAMRRTVIRATPGKPLFERPTQRAAMTARVHWRGVKAGNGIRGGGLTSRQGIRGRHADPMFSPEKNSAPRDRVAAKG